VVKARVMKWSIITEAFYNRDPIQNPPFFLGEVVSCLTYLYPEEAYKEIKIAFDEGLIDELLINLNFVNKVMAEGKKKALPNLKTDRYQIIKNTIKEMEWWDCFHQ
jgi:hypothetical protein